MIAGYEREMEIGKGCYCFKYIYNLFPSLLWHGWQTDKDEVYTELHNQKTCKFVLIKKKFIWDRRRIRC